MLLIALCTGLPLTGQVVFAQEQNPFREGTAAFRAGELDEAARHFERARAAGDTRPTLTFNLAVTYFRLGRNVDADRLFRELLPLRDWQDVATYNLGLVALQRNDTAGAHSWFTRVQRTGTDARVRALAAEQLATLDARAAESDRPKAPDTLGLFAIGAGVDSNVIAFPDPLQADSSEGRDGFVELLGYAQTYVFGRRGDGVQLDGYGYTRRHSTLDFLDPVAVGAGVRREQPWANATMHYGAVVGYTSIGGEALTTDLGLRLGIQYPMGPGRVLATYSSTAHSAGTSYPELEGTSHRLELGWETFGPVGFSASYRFEFNDRADRSIDDQFFSYSPIRHRLRGEARWRPVTRVTVRAGASHELSAFRGTNRMTDLDGEFRETDRRSNRTDLWLRSDYALTRQISIGGEVHHIANSDTFGFYEHDRSTVMVGLEYAFR